MIDIKEAKNVIQQQKQQIETQKQQIQQQRIPTSRRELQTRTRTALVKRRLSRQRLEQEKIKQLGEIKPQEENIKEAELEIKQLESNIKEQEAIKSDYERAVKVFESNRPEAIFSLENKRQEKFYRLLQQGKDAAIIEFVKDVEVAGGKVIFRNGEIVDIKLSEIADTKKLEELGIIPKSEIKVEEILPKTTGSITSQVIEGIKPTPSIERTWTTEERRIAEDTSSFNELIKKGNIPGAVRKVFRTGGTEFFKLSDTLRSKILGGKKLTDTELKKVGSVIGEVTLFGAFSPFMATGTTTLQKVFNKNKFEKLSESFKKLEKEFAKRNKEEQIKLASKIYKQLDSPESIKGFKDFLKVLKDKNIIKETIVKITKEGKIITSGIKPTGLIEVIREGKIPVGILNIKGVPTIGAGKVTSAFGISKLTETIISKIKKKPKQYVKLLESINLLPPQELEPILSVGPLVDVTETIKTSQTSSSRQQPKQTTTPILITPTITITPQIPKLKKPLRRGFYRLPRLESPLKLKSFPISTQETPTYRKLMALRQANQGVDVVVGMQIRKKRKIANNLPPFMALKKAQEYVDKNIEASFKLVKSGKKTNRKDIAPFNVGFKFRPSKTNPLYVVEKRAYRLDSPREKLQIKQSKNKKIKKNLFF